MIWLIKLLFICFLSFSVWAKGITAELDASQIEVGQQVRLTLTYDPKEAQGIPDLRVLQVDFTILATEQSTSYTVINGQARSIGQWGIVMEPKHTGMITIPALRIGVMTTDPIQLNVNPSTHAAPKQAIDRDTPEMDTQDATALTVTVDNKKPYLNQEILYKVRLMSRHHLLDARYQPPQVEDAILFPLGESQQSQTTKGNVIYQVNEQMYAIFPQKSGRLNITPPSLHALIDDFSPKPLTLTGDAVALDVQPLPKQIKRSEWLPSKLVRMQESYEQTATKLTQGTTVVRNIELQAQGLVAQLLPEIKFAEQTDLRVYPGQPERDNRIQQGELWGRYKLKITYVFPSEGTVILPAIKMPWFNVRTQKLEVAELPAKTYEIKSVEPVKPSRIHISRPKKNSAPTQLAYASSPAAWEVKPAILIGLLGIAMLLGLLSTLFYRWMHVSKPRRSLRIACKTNDIERIKMALVAWGRQQWPNKSISHFTDVIPLLPEQSLLWGALQEFSSKVYRSNSNSDWQGISLWQAVATFKKEGVVMDDRDATIPPIYPTRK